ncbi:MAG: glycosyltransferase [Verrucomicrobiota bacterium]
MILSVVICTHNPRPDYMDRTLAALQGQTLAREEWELLIVDNLSDIALNGVLDLAWHPRNRIIREEVLGTLPARVRGLLEAKADLILFVDDDNLLASNYLEQAVSLGSSHPFLGVWGGTNLPDFEVPPPAWIDDFRHLLACAVVEEDCWSNLKFSYATIPPTAGMCLRRVVADAFVASVQNDPRRKCLGRVGKHQLTGAEDMDLAMTACDIGLGTGLFTCLQLTHLIPAYRLTEDYMLRLSEGAAYCAHLLHALRGRPPTHNRSSGVRTILGSLRRHLFWSSRRRRHFEGQLRALQNACKLTATWH